MAGLAFRSASAYLRVHLTREMARRGVWRLSDAVSFPVFFRHVTEGEGLAAVKPEQG